jgi:hypothetical protein
MWRMRPTTSGSCCFACGWNEKTCATWGFSWLSPLLPSSHLYDLRFSLWCMGFDGWPCGGDTWWRATRLRSTGAAWRRPWRAQWRSCWVELNGSGHVTGLARQRELQSGARLERPGTAMEGSTEKRSDKARWEWPGGARRERSGGDHGGIDGERGRGNGCPTTSYPLTTKHKLDHPTLNQTWKMTIPNQVVGEPFIPQMIPLNQTGMKSKSSYKIIAVCFLTYKCYSCY